jgi:3-oxoadipate enol-lactonase
LGLDKLALRQRLMLGRTRAPEELAAAACPVLFIVGDEDILIAPFAADAIAAVVPQARVQHVADAGHSVYFERAQVFNRHVAEFLERAG